MEWQSLLLTFLGVLGWGVFVWALIKLLRNAERGKKHSLKRFSYHCRKNGGLLDLVNISTFSILLLVTILLFFICFLQKNFINNFWINTSPFVYLLPKSLFTPTSVIAIFGPTILSLNYRLFKEQALSQSSIPQNVYSKIYKTRLRKFIDAQFDHTHQLNSLVIAWGAFVFQILSSPINSLVKFSQSINYQVISSKNIDEGSDCCSKQEYGLGDAIGDIIKLVESNILSLIIVALAIGFATWTSIRLLSGQLSKTDIVELYEKDEKDKLSYPPITSRVTLYRFIFVLLSFLYLAWSEGYLKQVWLSTIFPKSHGGLDSSIVKNIQINNSMTTDVDKGLYFVLFSIFLILTYTVGAHYLANFKFSLKADIRKRKIKSAGTDNQNDE